MRRNPGLRSLSSASFGNTSMRIFHWSFIYLASQLSQPPRSRLTTQLCGSGNIIIILIIFNFIRYCFKAEQLLGSCRNQIESSQQNTFKCWFLQRRENRRTREKNSRNRVEIEPGKHWWLASALTTTSTLLPNGWY